MTIRVTPGPDATLVDRLAAQHAYDAARNELTRVRAAALAWRNGAAALLAGLIGFGLIKGRSDISKLAAPFDVIVGFVLLAALVTGATGAWLLLRAAHGRPAASSNRRTDPLNTDHTEAQTAARSLTAGLIFGLTCTILLSGAVGTTWYGPAKDELRLEVATPGGNRCGEVVRLRDGTLTLKTETGEIDIAMAQANGIKPTDTCAPATP